MAGAAAPAVAFGAAFAYLGGWFSQATDGRPSGLLWAVEIAPAHRLAGYENFATFEPVFGYEMLWCVAVGFIVMGAARRFALIGERAFSVQLALTFAGLCAAESLLIAPGSAAGRAARGSVGRDRHRAGRDRLSVPEQAPARPGRHRPAVAPQRHRPPGRIFSQSHSKCPGLGPCYTGRFPLTSRVRSR